MKSFQIFILFFLGLLATGCAHRGTNLVIINYEMWDRSYKLLMVSNPGIIENLYHRPLSPFIDTIEVDQSSLDLISEYIASNCHDRSDKDGEILYPIFIITQYTEKDTLTCYIQDRVSAVAYFGQLNKYIRESIKSNDSERILNTLRHYERRSQFLKSNAILSQKISYKKAF